MNCLNDNLLQTYIDGEGSESERSRIALHLEACEVCLSQYKLLKAHNEAATYAIASFYKAQALPEADFKPFKKDSTTGQLHSLKGERREMKSYKKYLATACAAMILVGGLATPPVRAAVGDAVSIFRAQDVKTVDVSLGDLKAIEESLRNSQGDIKIDNLADIKQSGGEFKIIAPEEAQALANFPLKAMPVATGLKLERTNIVTAVDMSFKLNIKNVNDLMKTLGATKPFDASLDGKTFSIQAPATVITSYSNADNSKSYSYSQSKLPEITAPEGTSVESLIESVASLGILPTELQSKLRALKDTGNTLYLPNVEGMLKEESIAGKKVFVSYETFDNKTYGNAIWMDNGVLRTLSGDFNAAELVKLIESIQ